MLYSRIYVSTVGVKGLI